MEPEFRTKQEIVKHLMSLFKQCMNSGTGFYPGFSSNFLSFEQLQMHKTERYSQRCLNTRTHA